MEECRRAALGTGAQGFTHPSQHTTIHSALCNVRLSTRPLISAQARERKGANDGLALCISLSIYIIQKRRVHVSFCTVPYFGVNIRWQRWRRAQRQKATRRLRWGEIRAANCLWQNLNITHKHEANAWLGYGFGTACDFFDFPIKLLFFQRNSHSFNTIHLNVATISQHAQSHAVAHSTLKAIDVSAEPAAPHHSNFAQPPRITVI